MNFKSISARIIFSVLPMAVLSTLIYMLMVYYIVSQQTSAQFDARMLENLNAAHLQIFSELRENTNVASSLAIYASTTSRDFKLEQLQAILTQEIAHNANTVGGGIWFEPHVIYEHKKIFGPYVYKDNDKLFWVPDYADKVNYHEEEWYKLGAASKGAVVWSDVYYDPVAKVTMVTASVPFFDEQGELMGVTTADMSLNTIREITSSIAIGNTGMAFLVGKKGKFISFFDESRGINHNISTDDNLELLKLGKAILNEDDGLTSMQWNNKQYRVFFSSIADVDWKLVVMIDTDEVGQVATGLIFPMLVLFVLGLFLISYAIISTARHFTRATKKVNHFADKAASGDLSERIVITGMDEFSIMEDRLNVMMDNLAKMTEQSENMLQTAQKANAAKSQFLSNMSHEMRTPMNAIMGMVQLAEQTNDINKLQGYISTIGYSSQNLLSLINNILDMVMVESDSLSVRVSRVSLNEVSDKIYKMFLAEAQEKNINFSIIIDENIPTVFYTDELRYMQIITNLVSNAVKFTPQGKIHVAWSLVDKTGTSIVIEARVSDSGIGIPAEAIDGLFLAFTQVDSSSSRKYGGSGLGLALCKELVELLGGKIWYEQGADGGSIFVFTVKAEIQEEQEQKCLDANTCYDFKDKTVLIVDDVLINREIIIAMLEETGIGIEQAENGMIACELFAKNPEKYDIIFMDIQMPEMDGLSATRQIRSMEEGAHVPIIAISANAFEDDIKASATAGINLHLAKPVNQQDMLKAMDRIFKNTC